MYKRQVRRHLRKLPEGQGTAQHRSGTVVLDRRQESFRTILHLWRSTQVFATAVSYTHLIVKCTELGDCFLPEILWYPFGMITTVSINTNFCYPILHGINHGLLLSLIHILLGHTNIFHCGQTEAITFFQANNSTSLHFFKRI